MEDLERSSGSFSLRLRQPGLVVYLCGIATSLLTILFVPAAALRGGISKRDAMEFLSSADIERMYPMDFV